MSAIRTYRPPLGPPHLRSYLTVGAILGIAVADSALLGAMRVDPVEFYIHSADAVRATQTSLLIATATGGVAGLVSGALAWLTVALGTCIANGLRAAVGPHPRIRQ